MSQTFDGSSTQNFITVYYSNTISAGSEIKVADKDGNVVLSYTAEKDFNFAIISSDKLITGETYTVSAGDNSEEITIVAGENTIGQSAGGMGGFGGTGGPGGMRAPDGTGGNPPSGQPPQKPTDANGNEIEMPQLPNGESNKSEDN